MVSATFFSAPCPSHLLQSCALVLHILGQQDEHAEVFVLEGKLYDLTVDAVNASHTERGLHVHHLHWFGLSLGKGQESK